MYFEGMIGFDVMLPSFCAE